MTSKPNTAIRGYVGSRMAFETAKLHATSVSSSDSLPPSPTRGSRSSGESHDVSEDAILAHADLSTNLPDPLGLRVGGQCCLSSRVARCPSWLTITPRGRIAQRESARFTRERSLVRSQVRPLERVQDRCRGSPLQSGILKVWDFFVGCRGSGGNRLVPELVPATRRTNSAYGHELRQMGRSPLDRSPCRFSLRWL
jgi:hypothetical protein